MKAIENRCKEAVRADPSPRVGERLSQFLGCFGASRLIDVVDSCKVRGWAGDTDFDVTFVEDEQGNVTLHTMEAES